MISWFILGQGLAQPQPWLSARERSRRNRVTPPSAPDHAPVAAPPAAARVAHCSSGDACGCADNRSTAVLVVAIGSSGSTWLAQRLERDPCVLSFIDHDTSNPDGKFREFSSGSARFEARLAFGGGASTHACAARGLMLDGERWPLVLNASSATAPAARVAAASAAAPSARPLAWRVLVLTREPFYVGLSTLKKRTLRNAARHGDLACANPAQRGNARLCPGATAAWKFKAPPRQLDLEVADAAAKLAAARARGRALERALRDASGGAAVADVLYGEVTYEELESAESPGALPPLLPMRVRELAGLLAAPADTAHAAAIACAERESGGGAPSAKPLAVKSSPSDPANALGNLAEVRAWAVENRAPWARFVGAPEKRRAGERTRRGHT